MNLPSLAQASAFGRHVLSYSMGAATMAVAVHVISSDQGTAITTAFSQIASGIASLTGGISTLIAVGSGLYAAWTASPLSQVKAVAAMPDVLGVVTAKSAEGQSLAAAATAPGALVTPAGTPQASTVAR